MITIEISQDVWDAIAKHGKFGETEDDVLRRILRLPEAPARRQLSHHRARGTRVRRATKRMSARVENGKLVVEFEDGARKEWALSDRGNKSALREVRAAAVAFALDNGASHPGQTNAVLKALTDAGYHLTK